MHWNKKKTNKKNNKKRKWRYKVVSFRARERLILALFFF